MTHNRQQPHQVHHVARGSSAEDGSSPEVVSSAEDVMLSPDAVSVNLRLCPRPSRRTNVY